MTDWLVTARVVRYGVPIEGRVLDHGCFARSLATWWLPVGRFGHKSLDRPVALAGAYADVADWLEVSFVTDDQSIVSGRPEFSVGFSFGKGQTRVTDADLHEITVTDRGVCQGTGITAMRQLANDEVETFPRVGEPTALRRSDWSHPGELLRETWGVRRADEALGDYWAGQKRHAQEFKAS